jgi:hypothetical protein
MGGLDKSIKRSSSIEQAVYGDAPRVSRNCEGICPMRYPHVKNVVRRLY